MRKRLFAALLALCMALALLPGTAGAVNTSGSCGVDGDEPSDNVTWQLDPATGVLTIRGNGAMRGYATVNPPWSGRIQKVVVENGVTSIGAYSFNNEWGRFNGLTSVTIPESVTLIANGAFAYCHSLKEITLPESVLEIGQVAFQDCDGLTSISIPSNVTNIEWCTFAGCTNLTSVYIPSSVTNIGLQAFQRCNNLTDVYYGGSASDWANVNIDPSYGGTSGPFVLGNDALLNATIHYNSTGPSDVPDQPDQPEEPEEYKIYRNGGYEVFDVSLEECMEKTPSTTYNPQLAHMLIAMCNSVFNNNEMTETFDSFHFDAKYRYEGTFLTYSMAKKQTEAGDLVLVVIRGSESGGDWVSNLDFATNDNGLHGGFADSANDLYDNMKRFLGDGADLSNTKFVITGFSRGAAVSNILAARLADEQIAQGHIYAYTFACPDVGKITADTASRYPCIFNVADINDMVSWVPSQLLSNDWYKFGNSYWYCRDWSDYKHISRNFGAHSQVAYMDFLRSEKNAYEYTGRDTAIQIVNDAVMRQAIPGSKVNGPYLIISCPVDVKVYSSDGKLIGGVTNNVASSVSEDKILIHIFGEEKHIFFLDDDSYAVEFYGTDTGTMTYTVQNMDVDTWEVIGCQTFAQVSLTDGKQFISTVKVEESIATEVEAKEIKLYVVDSTGTPEKEVLPDGSGTEVPVTKPDKPDQPDEPDTPDNPDKPDIPVTPDPPTYPTYPDTPSQSSGSTATTPSEPETPTEPAVPETPAQPEKPTPLPFTDVALDAYYCDAVRWAVEQGITTGVTATAFGPDQPCTRAQVVTFLWRASGSPVPQAGSSPFADVQPGAYYYDAVLWAVEQGITTGAAADAFHPDETVTRGQTAAFLYRAAGSPAISGGSPFTDVDSGAYYADAVQWAASREIATGAAAGVFDPDGPCTRAQIVTFLYRAK